MMGNRDMRLANSLPCRLCDAPNLSHRIGDDACPVDAGESVEFHPTQRFDPIRLDRVAALLAAIDHEWEMDPAEPERALVDWMRAVVAARGEL